MHAAMLKLALLQLLFAAGALACYIIFFTGRFEGSRRSRKGMQRA
jgi:hypothetical protein